MEDANSCCNKAASSAPVISRLDYCNSLLTGIPTNLMNWLEMVSSIGGTRHIHFFCSLARSTARSVWLWWRTPIQGIPDWFLRGHVTKQTKWPTHVVAATWPPHRVARRVTAWQRGADWLPGARHHNTTAWRAKYGTHADVSTTTLDALSQRLWSGEGGAFHSARPLTSHTTHTHSRPVKATATPGMCRPIEI